MASGDTLFVLSASSGVPPDATAAELVALAGASTPAESFKRLAFDDTTDEYWDWHLMMPEHYGGGGVTLTIVTSAAAASGNYTIGFAFRDIPDDAEDLDTTAHTYVFNDSSAITAPSAIGEVSYDTVTTTSAPAMRSSYGSTTMVLPAQ